MLLMIVYATHVHAHNMLPWHDAHACMHALHVWVGERRLRYTVQVRVTGRRGTVKYEVGRHGKHGGEKVCEEER
jgi:hypothetical protein